jgi:hypothetical protein
MQPRNSEGSKLTHNSEPPLLDIAVFIQKTLVLWPNPMRMI